MQTAIATFLKDTPEGKEADAILRSCVHCGFCLATCPTYTLLGDELDSPRGRIYLIKQVVEGQQVTAKTQLHLDRCMTCHSCETTCPSGVQYGHLLDIGRKLVEERVKRSWTQRLWHQGLRTVLSNRFLFTSLLRMAQGCRPLLPKPFKRWVPPYQYASPWPTPTHSRRMLILTGCIQPACAPGINAATARILDRLGISPIRARGEGCCGALSYHLHAQEEGKNYMRRNIDAWWPHLAAGAEAIVLTASGCGAMVKEYGYVLRNDPTYAKKAARISALTRDLSEILSREDLERLPSGQPTIQRIAFHSPCSLQHGQRLQGGVESILHRLGFTLTPVPDAHLCCGASGTYAILQQTLAQRALQNKLDNLYYGNPQVIATANIGCLLHLQTAAQVPVKHWIELLDTAIH